LGKKPDWTGPLNTILVYPAEISMDYQACIPAALAAIHNFIHIHDADELEGFVDADDKVFLQEC
jgi:hypothetical protein